MSSFGRLDVVVLALMLAYLFAVVSHVCWRYYLTRRARDIDSARSKTLAAALNVEVGSLKSIAVTAPFLGLAGTCLGIWSALTGGAMQRDAFRALIAMRIAVAIIPTAAGIPVAVLATCSYNYLRTRIQLLEVFGEGQQGGRHFRGARRFPPAKRFSEVPAYGLLAAPALAFAIAGFMTFASFHPPTGFYVELASARCEQNVVDRLIVLHITDSGKLFLNQEQEDWNALADRLSQIYSMREYRTLYLLADSGIPFQTVAHAIDTVENAPATVGRQAAGTTKDKLGIRVRLITPKAYDAGCATGSGHLVLR
jgi:biopolymer transport protein ExbD